MAKHMKLWVVAALVLAVAGTVVASNMGFKFVPNLTQFNKTYTVSLPINNNYTNADSLLLDINNSPPCHATKVEQMVPSTGGAQRNTWVGFGTAAQNFSISKGQGYIVEVNAGCTSWTVVGSHDPVFPYSFSLANKSYLTSIPYHTTATVANDLFTSITACAKVEKINVSTGGSSRLTWVGFGTGAQNFPVVIGEAYIIEVNPAGTGTPWTPSHY